MKKVLLIGGSGAIGQALIPLFDNTKYEVLWTNSREFPLPKTPLIHRAWRDIDVVINLSAWYFSNPLELYHTGNKKLIEVNCLGAVNILNYFLPIMQSSGYGRIIMISSVYSDINVLGYGVYSASKAFVDKLVKIAALENAPYGVTVNSIQLGFAGMGMGTLSTENNEKTLAKIGLKRFVTMQELYNTIDYIINIEYLTGQNIRLDGGIR